MEAWVFYNMFSENDIVYSSRDSICSLYHIKEFQVLRIRSFA